MSEAQTTPAPTATPARAARAGPAEVALFIVGAMLVVVALGVEALPLLRGAEDFSFGIGAYQLGVGTVAWLCITLALDSSATHATSAHYFHEWSRSVRQLVPIALEVGILVLVFRGFALENPAFYEILGPLVLVGFVAHELTPARYRPAFFLSLSLAALYLLMGATDSLWLVTIGVLLVATCHLPLRFGLRALLLLVMAVLLAGMRVGEVAFPWSDAVWPILGSIFMFRLIVYAYDLKHGKVAPGWAHRLGYFFLLPNVAFPLFPVVDYSAYRRGYYDTDRLVIYQRGVDWIVRGSVQLILYRLVYQEFTVPATAVATWDQLASHMLATFLLYLRVSGQFHLIIGLLHLFGFHLPETHKSYYASAGFTDFWRRINIYWKDFMMKVVYYPTFFALRKRGNTTAMVIATLLVFFSTWILHSYQWFWLLGTFPVTWPDTLFWGILAAILVVNALREAKYGRERSLGDKRLTFAATARRGLKIAVTFVVITVLWSLWMSPTVESWLALWQQPRGWSEDLSQRLVPLLLIGAMVAYAVGSGVLQRWQGNSLARARLSTGTVILALWAASAVPAEVVPPGTLRASAVALRSGALNEEDVTLLTRGYYEDLIGVSRFNSPLWEIYMRRPPAEDWPSIWETPAGRETAGFIGRELVPSASILYMGAPLTTNSFGMRDQAYSLVPPPGTRRIALMGASIEMGWGVGDDETFEAVVERELGEDSRRTGNRPIEILNFSQPYLLTGQLLSLQRVRQFAADAVVLAVHEIDAVRSAQNLVDRHAAGVAIPPQLENLRAIAEAEGLGVEPNEVVRQRLTARADEMEELLYREFVRLCEEYGILPVWLFVPMADRPVSPRADTMKERARAAGFTVLDLRDAYGDRDLRTLAITEFDNHPNARGHRLLARALMTQLELHPEVLGEQDE